MGGWGRFHETPLPDKEDKYSHLNMEKITNADYKHAKKILINVEMKNLGDYHDLYVQSGTLLIADVFGSFCNKCIELQKLNPTHFLSASGLAWQACLKGQK